MSNEKVTRHQLLFSKALNDPAVSHLGLGLLARILWRPYGPEFDWTEIQLAGRDTRTDIVLGIRELEENAYLRAFGSCRSFEVILPPREE